MRFMAFYRRPKPTPEEEIARIRLPRRGEGEILGIAIEMLGASRIRVQCEDGHTRIGRIPGKLRRRMWVRIGDLVVVKPWIVQEKEKADIVWRYTRTQAQWMKRNGKIGDLPYE